MFGHRRYSAAHAAGLESVPVIVAALSDEEARLAQIAENLERENVHPIEEGEAFQALITEHGRTREQIAEQYGKSLSYVTGRLKLLAAVPEVRKACLAGDIGSEVALLLARLRTPKLQEKALAAIKSKYYDLEDGGAKSYRQIRDLLVEKFTLELKGALFDTGDALLLADAGACTTCPKRSGNAPEFSDLQQAREGHWHGNKQPAQLEQCTDPDCWEAKTKAHLANRQAELESKGKTVIGGGKARAAISATGEVKGDYIPLKDVREALKQAKGDKPEVITILNPRDGKTVDVVKRADLQAAGVKGAAVKGRGTDLKAERKRREDQWQREEEKCQAESQRRRDLFARVRQAIAAAERSTFDLQLLATFVLDNVAHDELLHLHEVWQMPEGATLEERVSTMTPQELTLLMLDCVLVDRLKVTWVENIKQMPVPLAMAAKHYGIDPQASAKPADTPPGAARATKSGGKTKATAKARYRNDATGETWSGKGLQPAWLKAELAQGRTLADFDTAQGDLALEGAAA